MFFDRREGEGEDLGLVAGETRRRKTLHALTPTPLNTFLILIFGVGLTGQRVRRSDVNVVAETPHRLEIGLNSPILNGK
jgi:hypothetical protein